MTEKNDVHRRPRRGCLAWGCLLPALVVLALGIGGFLAARNYVRGHVDEWRADAPLVDLAITLLGLGGASETAPAALEAVRGDQDPAHLPAEIVVAAGAVPVVDITPDVLVVFQETNESRLDTERGLREALMGSGWRLVGESEVPGGREMRWSAPRFSCSYQVVEGMDATTEVWIRCVSPAADS